MNEENQALGGGPDMIEVQGAGQAVVNGIYLLSGVWEGAPRYTRRCEYRGADSELSLFKCIVSDKTEHWYISIVPHNCDPGTIADIDFYSAPSTESAGVPSSKVG